MSVAQRYRVTNGSVYAYVLRESVPPGDYDGHAEWDADKQLISAVLFLPYDAGRVRKVDIDVRRFVESGDVQMIE